MRFVGWKEIPLCSDVCSLFGSLHFFAYVRYSFFFLFFLVFPNDEKISDGLVWFCGCGQILPYVLVLFTLI